MITRLFLALLLLSLTACGPEVLFEEEREFTSNGWAYADSVSFDYTVGDTASQYDLVLTVGHGIDFPFQNFYVRLNTHLPDGSRLTQPLSLQLADKYGEWHGDCNADACSTDISIQEGTRFTATGNHRLVVAQYSRDESLGEIESLGFRVIKR